MALEICALAPEWEGPLVKFFSALRGSTEQFFHPHPFTAEFAGKLVRYSGRDLYYVLADEGAVLAYAMLRGWDEGFEVPSLGIAVHPEFRGQGLGDLMMSFLHCAARRRGARQIRLRVYPENDAARKLYERFGYKFERDADNWQLIGSCTL